MPSEFSATEKQHYGLHDAVHFMSPHIVKNKYQQSNLLVPRMEEDMALPEEIREDTQMDGIPNKCIPLKSNLLSQGPIMLQHTSCQNCNGSYKQHLLGK
jgi:hypothetical protein